MSGGAEVGVPVKSKERGHWVQTERKAHEAWAKFCIKKPTASAVLHHLVAHMGHQNAVVIPQKVIAQMLGITDRTVRSAIAALAADQWIQVIRLGRGKEAAYVVNDRVAWGQPRGELHLSAFSATIVADRSDQDALALNSEPLRRIPTLYPGERQLPAGPGEAPPSQPHLDGLEPDLPALRRED